MPAARKGSLSRVMIVGAAALLTLLGAVLIWWTVEVARVQAREEITRLTAALDRSVARVGVLHRIAANLFDGDAALTQAEFDHLFEEIIADPAFGGLRALGIAPRVRGDEMAAFLAENAAQAADGIVRGPIAIVPAGVRPVHFPVVIYTPEAGNDNVYGFDIFENAERRTAALAAARTGRTIASAPVVLSQDFSAPVLSLLFITPISADRDEDGLPPAFVAAGFTIAPAFARLDELRTATGVGFVIRDVGAGAAGENGRIVREYDAARAGEGNSVEVLRFGDQDHPLWRSVVERKTIAFAGRMWEVTARVDVLRSHPGAVLASGAVLIAMTAFGLLLITLFLRGAAERRQLADVVGQQAETLASANTELEAALSESRQANRAKDRFIAYLSHDLRTPLNAILGYGGMLKMRGKLALSEERIDGYLDRIEQAGRALQTLIEDLLTVSALQRRDVAPRLTVIAVPDFLESARAMALDGAERGDATVTLDCAADLPPIVSDERLLGRAVVNLIDNAVKYAGDGGKCWVAARRAEGKVVIEVSDDGRGFPLERLDSLRQPFARDDDPYVQGRSGHGLGLAIVHEVAAVLGITVALDNHADGGARVRLYVPEAQPVDATEGATDGPARQPVEG